MKRPPFAPALRLLSFASLPALAHAAEAAGELRPVTYFDIAEFRVEGVRTLPAGEVERIVYPHLGPARTADDVEAARAALEKAYHEKGYSAVSVIIPAQSPNGVVALRVIEGRVASLRVTGSEYSDIEKIKAEAPSLAPGKTPDFNAVKDDIVALNRSPDRRVTPEILPGAEPGTLDVELKVEDEPALHGSIELNNRHNPDTKPLRINGGLHYDNLWQLGHSIGFNFQIAPERPADAKVFSAYYIAKPLGANWLGLMVSAMKQDSDVNTLGDFNVAGRGETAGLRLLFDLPAGEKFYHSFSAGIDWKHYDTDLTSASSSGFSSPITYLPFGLDYNGSKIWADGSVTQFDIGFTWHFAGMGDDAEAFEAKRAGARADFAYLRTDISHTQELPAGFQLFGNVQAQATADALVSNEQMGVGGLNTVRGHLESEAVGDNALALSAELRSPSFTCGGSLGEWRVYAFGDWAGATLNDALPGQSSRFELASAGFGTRMKVNSHFSGSADFGVPLLDGPRTRAGNTDADLFSGSPFVTFTLRAEF